MSTSASVSKSSVTAGMLQSFEQSSTLGESSQERLVRLTSSTKCLLPLTSPKDVRTPPPPKKMDGGTVSFIIASCFAQFRKDSSAPNEEETNGLEHEIENMQQFYSWFSSMAQEGREEEEEKYR